VFSIGDFRFLVATTPSMIEAVHRLRYQVYVEEYGYEKVEDHPGGLEKDKFDPFSILIAALDKTDNVVGTIRIILNSAVGLPALKLVESHYQDKNPASPKIVEVSRFALTRSLRGKSGGHGFRQLDYYFKKVAGGTAPSVAGLENRVIVMLGLIHEMFSVMQQIQTSDFYFMTERRLWVLLKRNGLALHQVSPEINYHGQRACYVGHLKEVGPTMAGYRRALTQSLAETVQPDDPFHLPSLLAGENFEMGAIRFVSVEDNILFNDVKDFYRSFGFGEESGALRKLGTFHIAAVDRSGSVIGVASLLLDPHRASKKEGWVKRFIVPASTAPTAFRNKRKAVLTGFGLIRLLYWISKDLRLSRWKVALPSSLTDVLTAWGFRLRATEGPERIIVIDDLTGLPTDPASLRTLVTPLLTAVAPTRRESIR
jgi:N-acyl amino acid synthase of PEP-CTERM/exosortase system